VPCLKRGKITLQKHIFKAMLNGLKKKYFFLNFLAMFLIFNYESNSDKRAGLAKNIFNIYILILHLDIGAPF